MQCRVRLLRPVSGCWSASYGWIWGGLLMFLLGLSLTLQAAPLERIPLPPGQILPPIQLSDDTRSLVLGDNVAFLEDPAGALTAEDILAGKHAEHFFTIGPHRANFGFSTSVYWMRMRLQYRSYQEVSERRWWFKADYPLLDLIDVYLADGQGGWKHFALGDERPVANNGARVPQALFQLNTRVGEPVEIYIRVASQTSKQIGFVLYSDDALGRELVLLGAIGGAFYGIMIMMTLYNLVLYLSIKDRAYLYYVFAIASFVMVMVFVDGLPWVWGWFDDPDWYNKGVPISTLFTWFWLLAFSRKYLQTREHAPFADKVVMFLMIAALWCSIMSMYADYHVSIIVSTQVTILFAILLFCIGVREWRLGNQQARYYTLAWVAYMMGVLTYILYVYGVVERSLVTSIGVQLGAFSNVLLLSLALADRINMQKRETERAKQRALQSKQEAVEANRRATEHLKRFKQLYDNAAEGIFQCSLDGRFLSANPSLALTLGYESPAALIEGVENIAAQCYVDPQDRFAFEQRLQERRRVSGVESRYKRRDGSTFWGSSSAHMVFDAQGKPAYIEGSLIDITERTEKEEAQRERQAAEASAAAKSEFLANMSHEIRTPMNAIMGFADLALKTELNLKQRGYLTKIANASSTLLGIINDILDFSKIEAGKLDLEHVEFNLHDVINDLVDMLSHKTAEKGLELSVNLANGTPSALYGDPLRLGQILVNLTNNAIKFTSEGEIIIRISEHQAMDGRACLRFSVTDTGIGISKEQIARLFQPFTQADGSTTRKYGGTGLGLTICKQLVEMMEGEVWVESQEGRGSTFAFTAWFDLQPEYELKNIYASKELKDLRVLLIDDRDAGQEALMDILASFQCRATFIQPDYNLISRLRNEIQPDSCDLVIIDRQLAAMKTIDAALGIRQLPVFAEMPIIVMALSNEEHLISEATACGFYPLVKPVTPSVVLDSIQEIFGYTGPRTSRRFAPDSSDDDLGILDGKRALLVEDTPFNQEIATEFLRQVGMGVEVAQNGAEAVEKLQKRAEAYDVVLMDCQMPVMDGFEATRRIRHQLGLEDLPIIAMTANAMKGDRQKCLAAGMNDYISKPVSQDLLYQTLGRWLAGRTSSEASMAEDAGEADAAIPTLEVSASQDQPGAAAQTDLPALDLNLALAQMAGNQPLLDKLLGRFLDEQGEAVDRIIQAFDAGDRETAHRLAHTLKGMAASLGARALQHEAGRLEDALENGGVSTRIEHLFCAVDAAHQTLLSEITRLQEERV